MEPYVELAPGLGPGVQVERGHPGERDLIVEFSMCRTHGRSLVGALALGLRVAIHDARQNDRNPVIWQPGQDYRAADAIHAARYQPARARHGRERTGPER